MESRENKQKYTKSNYDPSFRTFPLADTVTTDRESGITIPSEDDVDEVKDWVDFKEM